jgi:hypothetical protein
MTTIAISGALFIIYNKLSERNLRWEGFAKKEVIRFGGLLSLHSHVGTTRRLLIAHVEPALHKAFDNGHTS